MINFIRQRLENLSYLAIIALLLGQLGKWNWFLELFSHFVSYYAVILMLAAVVVQKKPQRYIFAVLSGLLLIWLLQPISLFQAASSKTAQHSLIWYNVQINNPNPQREIDLILKKQPEILALAEINGEDMRWQPLCQAYPYGCGHREQSPFALELLSQSELAQCEVFSQDEIPYIRAQLIDGTAIYALHPPPPIDKELAKIRSDYLKAVHKKIAQEQAVLVVGDLNVTPFSPIYRQFASNLQATLPYYAATWIPFGLHLDHVLQRHISMIEVEVLARSESDHRALWVKWSLF